MILTIHRVEKLLPGDTGLAAECPICHRRVAVISREGDRMPGLTVRERDRGNARRRSDSVRAPPLQALSRCDQGRRGGRRLTQCVHICHLVRYIHRAQHGLSGIRVRPPTISRATGLPSQAMWRARATLILLAATLMACSSADEPQAQADPIVEAEAAVGIPAVPDQATADAYIAALNAIDPRIVGDDSEKAIDRGRDLCSTISANPDRAAQIESANQRFTAPEAPEGWGPEIAERILDVVHQHLCPTP